MFIFSVHSVAQSIHTVHLQKQFVLHKKFVLQKQFVHDTYTHNKYTS